MPAPLPSAAGSSMSTQDLLAWQAQIDQWVLYHSESDRIPQDAALADLRRLLRQPDPGALRQALLAAVPDAVAAVWAAAQAYPKPQDPRSEWAGLVPSYAEILLAQTLSSPQAIKLVLSGAQDWAHARGARALSTMVEGRWMEPALGLLQHGVALEGVGRAYATAWSRFMPHEGEDLWRLWQAIQAHPHAATIDWSEAHHGLMGGLGKQLGASSLPHRDVLGWGLAFARASALEDTPFVVAWPTLTPAVATVMREHGWGALSDTHLWVMANALVVSHLVGFSETLDGRAEAGQWDCEAPLRARGFPGRIGRLPNAPPRGHASQGWLVRTQLAHALVLAEPDWAQRVPSTMQPLATIRETLGEALRRSWPTWGQEVAAHTLAQALQQTLDSPKPQVGRHRPRL